MINGSFKIPELHIATVGINVRDQKNNFGLFKLNFRIILLMIKNLPIKARNTNVTILNI